MPKGLGKGGSAAVSEDAGPVEALRRDLVARVVVEHLVERVDRGAVEVIHPLVHGHVPHLVRGRGRFTYLVRGSVRVRVRVRVGAIRLGLRRRAVVRK